MRRDNTSTTKLKGRDSKRFAYDDIHIFRERKEKEKEKKKISDGSCGWLR